MRHPAQEMPSHKSTVCPLSEVQALTVATMPPNKNIALQDLEICPQILTVLPSNATPICQLNTVLLNSALDYLKSTEHHRRGVSVHLMVIARPVFVTLPRNSTALLPSEVDLHPSNMVLHPSAILLHNRTELRILEATICLRVTVHHQQETSGLTRNRPTRAVCRSNMELLQPVSREILLLSRTARPLPVVFLLSMVFLTPEMAAILILKVSSPAPCHSLMVHRVKEALTVTALSEVFRRSTALR